MIFSAGFLSVKSIAGIWREESLADACKKSLITGSSPVGDSEFSDADVAVRFASRLVIIMLVVIFGGPENSGRSQPGVYFISFFPQQGDNGFSLLLLCFIQVENLASVLRTDVRTLSVGLCRIVDFKKQFAQIGVGGLFSIKLHEGSFGMSCGVCLHFLIRRVLFVTSDVAYLRADHSFSPLKLMLCSPEASAGENCFFQFHVCCLFSLVRRTAAGRNGMFVRTVLGLMIVQTYKKFLISVPLRKLFCYLYLPNEYFQTDPNMKKLFFPIMFLLAAGSMQAQTYNELVEKAMDYTLKDSLVQAEQLFRQALKMEPGNARNALLFSNLGTVQKRMGKTDEAIESYTMALNITPYSTAMLLNRASLYLDKGLTDKAYLDYCNVIDLLPENQEARMFRAYIYMQRRQYTEARIDYNAVLAKDVRNLTARLGLVMLDQKEGKLTQALSSMNRLVDDYPKDVSLLKMRANLEVEMNQPQAALLDLEEALKLDANDREAYVQMGDLYLQLRKKKDAREAYEKAVSLGVSRGELEERLKECR